jgi:Uma2 family endonuclease
MRRSRDSTGSVTGETVSASGKIQQIPVFSASVRSERAAKCTVPPLVVVVAIRSPSTALIDLGRKHAYDQFGVPAFWIVDPRVNKPSLTFFELVRGRYQQTACISGDEPYRAQRPFPVEVVPSSLVAGLVTD